METLVQIGELIRRAARYYGSAPCLKQAERIVSFSEFNEATDQVGNALLNLGLVAGDRVGVLMDNSIECLVAYYALAKCGLVRVSLNYRDTEDEHNYKIVDSGARALIHSGGYKLDVEISISPDKFGNMLTDGDKSTCMVDRDMSAPYRLGYTGGTTGQPKAVTLTTKGEFAELSAFLMDLIPEINARDKFLHAAPIAHASGAFFLPSLVRGAQTIIMPRYDVQQFIGLAEKESATMTFMVPTMLAMLVEDPALDSAKLKLRQISYGASPMAPALLGRCEKRFGRIFAQTYGQAESPMVITCLKPDEHDRVGSCGRPFTFVDVAIFDEQDKPLAPEEIGEIVCRGPQLMDRYWNRPETTDKAFANGWLHTGDIGRMDKDGFFYILDRKNDMLISGGYNVYPREVEDVLLSYDGVIEAAVIGLPDEKWGDRVHAVVAGRPNLDVDDLIDYSKGSIANYKCPKSVEIWPELPKSPANKILRRKIKEEIMSRENVQEINSCA